MGCCDAVAPGCASGAGRSAALGAASAAARLTDAAVAAPPGAIWPPGIAGAAPTATQASNTSSSAAAVARRTSAAAPCGALAVCFDAPFMDSVVRPHSGAEHEPHVATIYHPTHPSSIAYTHARPAYDRHRRPGGPQEKRRRTLEGPPPLL